MPQRLEAGTVNGPGIAGLGAGVRFLRHVGVETVRHHELALRDRLREGLLSIPGVKVYGPSASDAVVGVLSFNLGDVDPLGQIIEYPID